MAAKTLGRGVRRFAAAAVLAGGSPAFAESPALFPVTAPDAPPQIEIFYGTAKVSPVRVPLPAPEPQHVVPASYKGGSSFKDAVHPDAALVEALYSMRDSSRQVSAATVGLLGKVSARIANSEPRQIVLASYTPAAQPAGMAASNAASQPTVVVVREPAGEPRPAAEPARGLVLGVEAIVALGLGLVGLLAGAIAWGHSGKAPAPVIVPVQAPEAGYRLMGQYNVGPMPETAEKFDLGPTYHDEQKQKKQTVEASNAAAVEFILNQNLALLAALNPGSEEGPPPTTDREGFALPATTGPAFA